MLSLSLLRLPTLTRYRGRPEENSIFLGYRGTQPATPEHNINLT